MATSAAAAKPAVAAAAAAAPAAASQSKRKLLLVGMLMIALLAAGAGAAWWFMHSTADDEHAEETWKPPIFLPLEQFTVNLQAEEGQQQYLQVAMTLSVADQQVAEDIKAQMPQARSRVLFLLSSKKPSQLATLEGKNALTEELIREVEAVLPPMKGQAKKRKKAHADEDEGNAKKNKKAKAKAKQEIEEEDSEARRVLAVYFTHFIVQ